MTAETPRNYEHLSAVAEEIRKLLAPLAEDDRGYVMFKSGYCTDCGADIKGKDGWLDTCHCENDE